MHEAAENAAADRIISNPEALTGTDVIAISSADLFLMFLKSKHALYDLLISRGTTLYSPFSSLPFTKTK